MEVKICTSLKESRPNFGLSIEILFVIIQKKVTAKIHLAYLHIFILH